MQKVLFSLLGMLVLLAAQGQVTIRPNVMQAGMLQKSQLWNISAVCLQDDGTEALVELTLTDRVSGLPVLIGNSAPVRLSKGVKLYTEADLSPITYTTPNARFDIQTTGLLPAGLYQACFRVFNAQRKGDPLAEECLAIDVEALSPPLLNLPADSAVLSARYPQFVWLPPTPLTIFPDLQYDFILSEVMGRQTGPEAIQRNMPLYSSSSLRQNSLIYPASFPALDTGKWYAWQIMARNGNGYGAKSDVWVFRMQPGGPVQTPAALVYYPKLTKGIYDALYLAGAPVRFEFENERNEASAEIQLFHTGGDQQQVLARKTIALQAGPNYITWNVDLPKPKADAPLILKLVLPSGDTWGCLLRTSPAKP